MKYFVTLGSQTHEISIDHPNEIVVDGVAMAADMQLVNGRNLYSLLIENKSYEIVLDSSGEPRGAYGLMVSGQLYVAKVQDERSRRLAQADHTIKAPSGELPIKAPIPGLVVKLLVTPGQSVHEDEPLLILEAMKMENELRATRAGIVHEVRVQAGALVAVGQVLLTLK